jgi:hypothetical protein
MVMTAALAPAPSRRVPLAGPARLLRLELRRNPMVWLLPLLAALFWLGVYRPAMANPPFWNARATDLQHAVLFLGPLLAGATAWTGSRDGRRGLTDLVGVTAVPRWPAQLASWAATTCWAEAVYLGGVAAVYGVTAEQAHWGGPLWWPVAVGAAGVATCCALGFAAGALLPGRFTAALASVAVFLMLGGGAFALQNNGTFAQIWPLNVQGPLPRDSYGIFYPYLPDLAIAQLMFLGGLALAALGAVGLPTAAGGRWLRGAAAALAAAGLAAAGTAVALAGTARLEAHGVVIPALHDAASDRPTSYAPVCSHSAVPVCMHPAYRSFLPAVTAALGPALDQVAGLPGAPVRVTQVAVTSVQQESSNGVQLGGPDIAGSPPVVYLPLAGLSLPGEGSTTAQFVETLRSQDASAILNALVGLSGQEGLPGGVSAQGNDVAPPPGSRMAAQVAVAEALAQVAGLSPGGAPLAGDGRTPASSRRPGNGRNPVGKGSTSVSAAELAAARRLAALPAAMRRAWLVAHLAALRAGRVALSEIP